MNKTPESWRRINIGEVYTWNRDEVRDLLVLALDDIRTLAMQVNYWRELAKYHFNRNQEHVRDS